jgi:phospholipid/cholesterol/gamma-HCH transport system substrate-binding protein
MTIKKEIKVGVLGLVALIVFYIGFNFLKGSDLFSTVAEYKVQYQDVQGLEISNPVTYNGVNIGRVLKMTPNYEKNVIDVTLAINKKLSVSEGTTAILADNGLIGGKLIKLILGKGKRLKDGSQLASSLETGLMQNVQDKLTPTLKNVDSLLITVTSIVKEFSSTGDALKVLMANATQTTTGVNAVIGNNAANLGKITSNAALLTENLNALSKSLDQQIKPLLSKTGTFADSLNQLQLGKTVSNLNSTIKGL